MQQSVIHESKPAPRELAAGWRIPTAWRTLIAGGITVVAWSSAFAGIRVGLEGYSPTHLALLRYLVASALLLVYAVVTRMPLPKWRDLPGLAALGLAGIAIYNVALGYGEVSVPAATASFIVASAPMWMVLLARFLFGERLRGWGWVGICVSFAGVTAIALGKQGSLQLDPLALVVLVAALAQSLYSLGQRSFLSRYSALQCAAYAIWAGTVFLLAFGAGLPGELGTAPVRSTAAIVYLGIVPGALGYVMWSYVLARVTAARAGSFLYMVPPFALVIAWIWLHEVPAFLSILGGLLVLAGVILVNTLGKRSGKLASNAQSN